MKSARITEIFKIELHPDRVFGLDILRAIAILSVVIAHGSFMLPKKVRAFNGLFSFDGVSIFFVLSGFLIGGILIKLIDKNTINGKLLVDFWIRRWFRTLPNYFLILLLLLTLNSIFYKDFSVYKVSRYFVFCQNLFQNAPFSFFPESWSLSVEEWFYLTVPLLIMLLIWGFKISTRTAVWLTAVLVILVVTGFRYYRFENNDIDTILTMETLIHFQVSTRLDSLMYGVIGAYLNFYHFDLWIRRKKLLLFIGIGFFLYCTYFPMTDFFLFSTLFKYSLFSIAILLTLPFLSQLKTGKGILYKLLTYVSLTSYSMYLLNYSIIQVWIINKINWIAITQNTYFIVFGKYGLYWFLVITLSILLYKFFEIPMTKLRDSIGQKVTTFTTASPK